MDTVGSERPQRFLFEFVVWRMWTKGIEAGFASLQKYMATYMAMSVFKQNIALSSD